MNTFAKTATCALCLCLFSTFLQAGKLQKCTDENGNITFSDTACPESTAERQEIQTRHSQPAPTDDYWSIGSQLERMKADKANARQERAFRRQIDQNRTRQFQMERTAKENQKKAQELSEDAQGLYRKAARRNAKRQKQEQKALIEQARSLERQADVLLGRRETAALTQMERIEQRVTEAEELAQDAEEKARRAEAAAQQAKNAARWAK